MVLVLRHRADALGVSEALNFRDVFVTQLEVENIKVADDSVLGDRLGDDNVADLNLVADQNLSWRLVVLCSDCNKLWFLQDEAVFRGGPWTTGRAEWAVSSNGDVLAAAMRNQCLVKQVGIDLELVGNWLNSRVCDDAVDLLDVEVTDADRLGQAGVNQCFHSFPCFNDVNVVMQKLAVSALK